MYQFEKQFRIENPETINEDEDYSILDLEKYKDWLEHKLIESCLALSELTYQVEQYTKGDSNDIVYFKDELKLAKLALVPIG